MPLPSTMTPIATQTLTSAAGTVTFSSISGAYRDLVLVIDGSLSTSDWTLGLQCNSDTSALYSATYITGNGTAASSGRASAETMALVGSMTNSQSNSIIQIQNYSNTTTFKTFLGRGNATANRVRAYVGLYRSTSAITALTLKLYGGGGGDTFSTGTVMSLYGIAAA